MSALLTQIHARLNLLGATVGVAESLTGGLLTSALTQTPGASRTVRGGLVVYATDLKASLADVDPALLELRGPVDGAVALALAHGALARLGATYGLGVTGVAGPDPQDGRAVGTVFGAVVGPVGELVQCWLLGGTRSEIRAAAVQHCLELLLSECRRSI